MFQNNFQMECTDRSFSLFLPKLLVTQQHLLPIQWEHFKTKFFCSSFQFSIAEPASQPAKQTNSFRYLIKKSTGKTGIRVSFAVASVKEGIIEDDCTIQAASEQAFMFSDCYKSFDKSKYKNTLRQCQCQFQRLYFQFIQCFHS